MQYTSILLSLFLATLGLTPVLNAQSADPNTPEPVSIRILLHSKKTAKIVEISDALNKLEASDTIYFFKTPEGFSPLPLKPNKVSRDIEYIGDPQFTVYQKSEEVDASGEPIYEPRMHATLSGNTRNYLLCAQESDASVTGIQLQSIPIDTDSVPRGTVLCYNLGEVELMIKTQSESIALSPKTYSKVDLSGSKPFSFRILAAVKGKQKTQLVYRRVWPTSPNTRAVSLFFPVDEVTRRWNAEIVNLD